MAIMSYYDKLIPNTCALQSRINKLNFPHCKATAMHPLWPRHGVAVHLLVLIPITMSLGGCGCDCNFVCERGSVRSLLMCQLVTVSTPSQH